MTVKISMLFQQSQGAERIAGWSENWYANGVVNAHTMDIFFVAQRRVNFLSMQATFIGYRISDLAGGTLIRTYNLPGTMRQAVDIPQMALNVSVGGAGVAQRKVFQLRGIPDVAVDNGLWLPPAGMLASVNAYLSALGTSGAYYRVKKQNTARSNVLSIAPNGDFVFAAGVVPTANQTVQLLRCRDVNGKNLSGEYLVINDANGLPKRLANWGNYTVSASGKARISDYDYVAVTDGSGTIGRITTRKVGRPFFLYRGRQTR